MRFPSSSSTRSTRSSASTRARWRTIAARSRASSVQLAYCRITSPIGGRVGLRQVDPGNIVHATDAGGLVVITQLQPIAVVFTIPEDSIPAVLDRIARGTPVPVDAYDREQRRQLASGTLLTIDNQVDPTTGTVKLKATFPNTDGRLFSSQFVNARLLLDVKRARHGGPRGGRPARRRRRVRLRGDARADRDRPSRSPSESPTATTSPSTAG